MPGEASPRVAGPSVIIGAWLSRTWCLAGSRSAGGGRRSLYGMLLAQGHRNDIARFVNGDLLRQDWPLIRKSLEPRLSRRCERRFGLSTAAADCARSAAGSPG